MSVELVGVDPRDPEVGTVLARLDAELGEGGYTPEQTFGYDVSRLVARGVHLLGAYVGDVLVGIGGVEVEGAYAELKRMYVDPAHRGRGVADLLVAALLDHARGAGAATVRLETGDAQHAAIAFYRRHGFDRVDRFGPYVDSATSVCLSRPL